ncbi:MAG TPA: hypothetical protein VJR26_09395 [Candidatus Acidoferrales bacterium]|nr:hypothetical protein [Candidatus Acidoferrales bacterium]
MPTRNICAVLVLIASGIVCFAAISQGARAQEESPNREQASQAASPNSDSASEVSRRGMKLMLKDGTFQLVREYKIEEDRIRFYSIDRSDWEEIPASLVDWDATKKAEAEAGNAGAALVKKARRQEEERRTMQLGIDASLEVAPGVFLPPGEGVWVFNNKAVLQLPSAEPTYKTNKKHQIEKILVPIPVISTRHSVMINGAHAKVRIRTGQPEFYMRTKANSEPELELVSAEVEGAHRKIGRVDQLFKMEQATVNPLMMQRWQVANEVYRFTLGQTLRPGEYALVEVIPGRTDLDQLSVYVWDFGVDAASGETKRASK